MADKKNIDSDDSDDDYVPEVKDGNVSEEADSGDAESDLEEDQDAPKTKRRRKSKETETKCSPKKEETKIDVNALWSDFKKEANESKDGPVEVKATGSKVIVPTVKSSPLSKITPTSLKSNNSGGGLAGILGKIGKKDKLSTLEKSRLDWMNFKTAEGIDEDIQKHNRGKDGFLQKRDFLERTDVRQFELEKEMRTLKRSSR